MIWLLTTCTEENKMKPFEFLKLNFLNVYMICFFCMSRQKLARNLQYICNIPVIYL